jgi:hypothetical protein
MIFEFLLELGGLRIGVKPNTYGYVICGILLVNRIFRDQKTVLFRDFSLQIFQILRPL